MKIEVGLSIPFDGDPVSFRFAFCSREAPFTLTVWVFGGGGFVGLVLGVDGVELLEFSFEFGGGWAIDVVVASGKVEAKAGIYFKLETVEENGKNIQKVHLEAYFRLHGSVEVLDASAAGTGMVERAEDENAHVLLLDEAGSGVWSDLCARQADRTLLVATDQTMPPAGPTGRCKASTQPSNRPATRAASLNDMAASGPPSDTARIDLNIENSPIGRTRLRSACGPHASRDFRLSRHAADRASSRLLIQ